MSAFLGEKPILKIKAKVSVIQRAKIKPPDDGVHVAGKEGFIKGVHSLWFHLADGPTRLVPKGQTAFYYAGKKPDIGYRVSYSFGWLKPISERIVKKEYETMLKCRLLGISPKPFGMEKVKLNLYYEHENAHISCPAWAIRVQHAHYPREAWQKYAEGYPYDWTADGHPDHSPEGFKRFVADAKAKAGKLISTSWKLGDVVWCTKEKRWFLVDPGK
jgi:hypothetical protein